jgi:uncharacterized protein (DUF849 family)
VTGGDDVADRFKAIPVTPAQIAEASVEACKAGAAIAHIHVRDPATGKPSMALDLYREVVARIRDSGSPVIVNLTTGPGARFVPGDEGVNTVAPGSNLRGPAERVRHIVELRPDICSLDMGTLNFGKGALINVPSHVRAIAAEIRAAGVKPELEVFDTGHVALALDMIDKGLLDPAPLFQAVLGVPWGAPATTETMALFKALFPHGSQWAAFGVGRHEFPMVAQAALLGGHVRVGLEDNLYLERGRPAKNNAELVEKAVRVVRMMGEDVATPAEARALLGLPEAAR